MKCFFNGQTHIIICSHATWRTIQHIKCFTFLTIGGPSKLHVRVRYTLNAPWISWCSFMCWTHWRNRNPSSLDRPLRPHNLEVIPPPPNSSTGYATYATRNDICRWPLTSTSVCSHVLEFSVFARPCFGDSFIRVDVRSLDVHSFINSVGKTSYWIAVFIPAN